MSRRVQRLCGCTMLRTNVVPLFAVNPDSRGEHSALVVNEHQAAAFLNCRNGANPPWLPGGLRTKRQQPKTLADLQALCHRAQTNSRLTAESTSTHFERTGSTRKPAPSEHGAYLTIISSTGPAETNCAAM